MESLTSQQKDGASIIKKDSIETRLYGSLLYYFSWEASFLGFFGRNSRWIFKARSEFQHGG